MPRKKAEVIDPQRYYCYKCYHEDDIGAFSPDKSDFRTKYTCPECSTISRRRPPSPKTVACRRSLLAKLESVFGQDYVIRRLSQDDYPEVLEALGWKQSTFKTALRYLGRPNDQLLQFSRDYIPTEEEVGILSNKVGPAFMMTLKVTGVRLYEMWRMTIYTGQLYVHTLKGNESRSFNMREWPREVKMLVTDWVERGSKRTSYRAIQGRFTRLAKAGLIDRNCTPHSLRHRWATLQAEAGMSLSELSSSLGHSTTTHTRNYVHRSAKHSKSMVERVV